MGYTVGKSHGSYGSHGRARPGSFFLDCCVLELVMGNLFGWRAGHSLLQAVAANACPDIPRQESCDPLPAVVEAVVWSPRSPSINQLKHCRVQFGCFQFCAAVLVEPCIEYLD